MTKDSVDTETRILDLAEHLIRKNGYNGFSFRDIATGVGVKSSSVHYYFPTKAELGAKVARRYTDRFLESLDVPDPNSGSAEDAVAIMHGAFFNSLKRDGQMCLCGVLAAESAGLPEEVIAEAKSFFQRTTDWLTANLQKSSWGKNRTKDKIEQQSMAILAQLEGGLLIARVRKEPELFQILMPALTAEQN
ncbi:MAG: TetR/AcrR family transcriptional regulator [Roseibium sp.]|uniref:TetR/AcrR family transcriptional regulator n=1 Tax=Roseibium sp. TaxID=1936156 RepID=UPI001AFDC338|nr:TetR/AcrR family transcriptional regulator [Roseibium sp.]MBO6892150.1 TetR/AcrR family transcriptional regulator [Roseibium sp.]MBO6933126.1 TetR/AcrR family transcriptional regulator [Roseibium sp.]